MLIVVSFRINVTQPLLHGKPAFCCPGVRRYRPLNLPSKRKRGFGKPLFSCNSDVIRAGVDPVQILEVLELLVLLFGKFVPGVNVFLELQEVLIDFFAHGVFGGQIVQYFLGQFFKGL